MTWALLAEIDEAEVQKPIKTFLLWISILSAAIAAAVVVMAILLGNQISRPLKKCVGLAQAISEGDMTQRIEMQ